MFPRRLRLSRGDFTAISQDRTAKRAASAHFSAVYSPQVPKGGCAVVVPKKIIKTSVRRHLLKRRMRSVMQNWCVPDATLIVYAREGSGTLPFPELSTELSSLLERLTPRNSQIS